MESLRACGFTGDELVKLSEQNPDVEVQIVVEHETWEGKVRAKVKWINSLARGFVLEEPLDDKSVRMFSAQMKGKLKMVKEVAGKKAERQPPSAGVDASEDRGDDPAMDQRLPDIGPASDDLPF